MFGKRLIAKGEYAFMEALVGYTGFVGSNLDMEGHFDKKYNSKNISEAYGLNPDLLVYAGLKAEKYLANKAPEKDMELIEEAFNNIVKINPQRLVLISTVDVFKKPVDVDEDSPIETENLHPYGYNRYLLENKVRTAFPDALIIRLPALYGVNLKKNFLYDFINLIPFMLSKDKFSELSALNNFLRQFYELQDNGFYKLLPLAQEEKRFLKSFFQNIGFTALNFTDSGSFYQFYPLKRLYKDMTVVLKENIRLWHPAVEPVSASEVCNYVAGLNFKNELSSSPAFYDYKTKYYELFGGKNGYIMTKDDILRDIKDFYYSQI